MSCELGPCILCPLAKGPGASEIQPQNNSLPCPQNQITFFTLTFHQRHCISYSCPRRQFRAVGGVLTSVGNTFQDGDLQSEHTRSIAWNCPSPDPHCFTPKRERVEKKNLSRLSFMLSIDATQNPPPVSLSSRYHLLDWHMG